MLRSHVVLTKAAAPQSLYLSTRWLLDSTSPIAPISAIQPNFAGITVPEKAGMTGLWDNDSALQRRFIPIRKLSWLTSI